MTELEELQAAYDKSLLEEKETFETSYTARIKRAACSEALDAHIKELAKNAD